MNSPNRQDGKPAGARMAMQGEQENPAHTYVTRCAPPCDHCYTDSGDLFGETLAGGRIPFHHMRLGFAVWTGLAVPIVPASCAHVQAPVIAVREDWGQRSLPHHGPCLRSVSANGSIRRNGDKPSPRMPCVRHDRRLGANHPAPLVSSVPRLFVLAAILRGETEVLIPVMWRDYASGVSGRAA